MNGEILIVDEHTGRMLAGRRYNEGMHQAIEAKEGVEIQNENQTLATITLQNYFRMYDKLSGMTGTAQTEAAELNSIYKLGVVPIPTNRPMIRADQADLVYRTEEAKFNAVVDDIVERHAAGQPVLVGTVSVEKSEYLSDQLRRRGVPHEVLNAKQHEREAAIVAQAGRKGAVTVATNMAGRGTDIMLGGNPEFMAVAALKQQGLDPDETPEEYEAAWAERPRGRREGRRQPSTTRSPSSAGSTSSAPSGTSRAASTTSCVVAPAARATRARAGSTSRCRTTSCGCSTRRMVDRFMTTAKMEDDVPIESKMVTRSIQSAQSQVEAPNFEIRKNVLKYDDVLNRQREVIYAERRRVLEGEDLHEQIRHFIDDVVDGYVDRRHGRRLRRGLGPRPAVDRAEDALPGLHHRRGGRGRRRRPVQRHRRDAARGAALRRPPRVRRARGGARRRGACARSSAGSSCRCSTASGASTSTRWTTCRRASACGRWPSATRWWSTSARASCSSRR